MVSISSKWTLRSRYLALIILVLPNVLHAQRAQCKTFGAADASYASKAVQDYLMKFSGSLVRVCGDAANPLYLATTGVSKEGRFCNYLQYELRLSQAGGVHLEREIDSREKYVLITDSRCPSATASEYTATNNVSQDVFAQLHRVWINAISSSQSFSAKTYDKADKSTFDQILSAILKGKSGEFTIVSVTNDVNFGIFAKYTLKVRDPIHPDRFYAVNVIGAFGIIYYIRSITPGLY